MNGVGARPAAEARSGAAYAVGAALLWPVIEILGGLLSRTHPPLQTVWLRYSAHVAILLVVALPRAGRGLIATRHPLRQLQRGFLMFLMPVAFVVGVARAPLSGVWSAFWVAPALVALAGRGVLGERAGPVLWAATLLGWVGAVVTLGPGGETVAALLSGIGMAAALAGYLLLSRTLRDEALSASLFYTGIGALAPLTLLMPARWAPVGIGDLGIVVLLGAASLAFLAFLDRAVEHAPAVGVAPLLYAILPAEAGASALLGRTMPSGHVLAGLVLVSCALALALFGRSLRSHPTPTAGSTP